MKNLKIFINKYRSRFLAIVHDSLAVTMAWFGAYWLRFNLDEIPAPLLQQAKLLLPMMLLTQAMGFAIYRTYRGVWRYTSILDIFRILKAVALSSILFLIFLFFDEQFSGFPRSVLPLYILLATGILCGTRLLYRLVKQQPIVKAGDKRVLIVGAGQAGEGLARDLLRNRNDNYYPVAFVDDHPKKMGQEIHGIRVAGQCQHIPQLVKELNVDLVMIAIPSAGSSKMRQIVSYCEKSGVPFYTLPSLQDLTSGAITVNALRPVLLEDLLGRDPVSLDVAAIADQLTNHVVLISGGGGSIGSELCRQISRWSPKELIVVENNEYNLYQLQNELAEKFPQLNFQSYLTDITDENAVSFILNKHRPSIVFHAAAYKHVPILEFQVREAVKNNILGTYNLAAQSKKYQVKNFILISTDKAVNPTNVMGATKRAAEMICQELNGDHNTKFIIVRFGNVLGSMGSVVPLFQTQIARGGPVTVTHPEITRYFMTIPEAAQLIVQASVLGQGGEIFVLDMGEPVKINYLAEQMIRLSGRQVGEDIRIVYSGLRPGEKLHEELFYQTEQLIQTEHEKILKATHCHRTDFESTAAIAQFAQACSTFNLEQIMLLLKQMVCSYQPLNENTNSGEEEIIS